MLPFLSPLASRLSPLALVVVSTALAGACSSSGSSPESPPFEASDAAPPPQSDSAAIPPTTTNPEAGTPPPTPGPTVTNEAIKVGGVTRTYVLVVPLTYDASKKYPLVFAFHGSFGTGQQFRDFFKLERASGEGALVAYPDGILADHEWDLDSVPSKNQDVLMFDAIVGDLSSRFSVEKTRVFATGWSNGGFFSNRLACSRSAAVRAISSLSGGAPYDSTNVLGRYKPDYVKCPSEGPVASMSIHGLDDPEVDVSSGEFSAMYWAFVNGCTDSRAPTTPSPCEAYKGCPADKPSLFCPFPGIGHGIPPTGADLTWNFFKSIP